MISSNPPITSIKRRANWLTWVSLGIIIVVIMAELSLAFTLPRMIKSRRQWGEEITRQRLLALMDQLRQRCQGLSQSPTSEIDRETLQLVENQLDELMLYLRAHADRLDSSQLLEFEEDLRYFATIMDKLEAGTLNPAAVTIEADKYVRAILEGQEKK